MADDAPAPAGDGLILGDSLSAIPEAAVDPFAGGMVGEDDSPAVLPPKPTAPPPTKVVEAAAAAPPEVVAEAAGAAAATGGVRGLTVEEKAAEASLLQEREELKQAEVASKERSDAQKVVQDKVVAAVQTRTSIASLGAKDLMAFIKGSADLEDKSGKAFSSFGGLFGNETGTASEALTSYAASCKSMQTLHADLHQTLTSVELKRAEEALAAVDERTKALVSAATTMAADFTSARDKAQRAFLAQEKAWEQCSEASAAGVFVTAPEADPWLAGLRYQAAAKTLETVEAAHGSGLRRLVNDLKDMDSARLQATKGVLRSLAESRRSLLVKALANAEELCDLVERVNPEEDCPAFLITAEIQDEDLGPAGTPGDATPIEAVGTLGVWIPDGAVRQCNRCSFTFNLMRRKHHCRRCGHVFCDKCSNRHAILAPSFGFGQAVQRVCETCFELVQASPNGDSPVGMQASDFEVIKEGALLRKSDLAGSFKPRHFVCTKAGFLHHFESKFDQAPKGSICLHFAKISTVEDDPCAISIETGEAGPGAKFWQRGSSGGKKKHYLRSPAGSLDRDAWLSCLQAQSKLTPPGAQNAA